MSTVQEMASDLGLDVTSEAFAAAMDERDELAGLRAKFLFPPAPQTCTDTTRKETLYLCGNSLGLQPKDTRKYVNEELDKWEQHGVEGHFTEPRPWVTIDETVQEMMANVVGARSHEVVVMNSLTTNLHLMMVAFYRPKGERYKILLEAKAFPSDEHAFQSQARFHGYDPDDALIRLSPRDGEQTLRTEDIERVLAEQGSCIATVLFSGVQYYTGQLFDIPRITAAAHAAGAEVGFDLAHAAGNAELKLHDWNVDFGVWCNYKYINAGPGAIGGCFVHERHAGDTLETRPRFAGWWGHRKSDRFEMRPDFITMQGAVGYQLSNPPVFQIAALRASLDVFEEATMSRLRAKSVLLTALLEVLLAEAFNDSELTVITPADPAARGCQLSLLFKTPIKAVHERITAEGVICDMREPDVMRIAPAPLYNSFADVHSFVRLLRDAVSAEIASGART